MKKKENGQKMPKRKRWLLRIMIFCVILIFCWLQNNLLTVTFYNFSCEKWNNEEAGFRIVQLSDLHNASFGYGNRHLIDKVKALEPDMIVLTGDLVDANHTKLEVAGSLVKELTGICPVYFVDGNHEVWLDEAEKQKLFETLENAGVNVLLNAC